MKYYLSLISLIVLLTGCEKIIAEDITDEIPVLILPTPGSIITDNPVHFKWEEMEGASKYHLMVVSPSFANPQTFVLDSMITGTDFYFSLDSNFYELKLVGVNGGYRSDTLGPIAFEVNAAGGTGSNSVVLTSPVDGAAENATFNQNFTWQSLASATSYEFSLREGTDFSTGNIIETNNGIVTTNYTVSAAIPEGEYIWGVKAYLTSGETAFTTHQFVVDTVAPNQALLSQPANGSTQASGTITFVWNNGTDPGTVNTAVTSQIEYSDDASFLNSTTIDVSGNTVDIDFTSGTYYWRVLNFDAAGNMAAVSTTFDFIIF